MNKIRPLYLLFVLKKRQKLPQDAKIQKYPSGGLLKAPVTFSCHIDSYHQHLQHLMTVYRQKRPFYTVISTPVKSAPMQNVLILFVLISRPLIKLT